MEKQAGKEGADQAPHCIGHVVEAHIDCCFFAVGLLALKFQSGALAASGWSFLAGTAIFSGSLYALALSGVKVLGAITPIGGLMFIVGWVLLAVAVIKG